MHQGRVVYGAIEEVVFGHPAADRLGTQRAFLMVTGGTRLSMGARSAGVPMGASHGIGDVLGAFIRSLGIPRSLSDVRVSPDHFDAIAEQAMRTPRVPRNPRGIDGPAAVREILLLAA